MSKVKFTKEIVLDRRYEGSKETFWWNDTASKRLGRVYAKSEGYGWAIFDEDGNRIVYLDMHSKKSDASDWLETYDERMDEKETKERAEREESEKRFNRIREIENMLTEYFKKDVKSFIPEEGQYINVYQPSTSKNCNIGEALLHLQTCYSELYPNESIEPFRVEKAKVHKVVKLSNDEFDHFIENLMEAQEFFVRDENGVIGGNMSEDPRLDGHEFPVIYNDLVLKEIWFSTNFQVVHAITAPNRRTFFVNTHGYNYARYVSFAV